MSKYNHIDYLIDKEHKVLDKGFVRLVDYMGSDNSIVQAARVSYNANNKEHTQESDAKLLNYLMKHQHTSPFEMCEITLHIKAPLFIARQWMRHRTASYNEISARYTEPNDDFYIPHIDNIKKQHAGNKQCSGDELLDESIAKYFINTTQKTSKNFLENYQYFNGDSVKLAREMNRINMPVNYYTEFYYKTNLKNLLHFLKLRTHTHAQFEIREYANVVLDIVNRWCPVASKAFIEHEVEAVKLSKKQIETLQQIYANRNIGTAKDYNLSERDFKELCDIIKS